MPASSSTCRRRAVFGRSSSAGAGWPFARRTRSMSSEASAPEVGNSSPSRSHNAAASAYTCRTVGLRSPSRAGASTSFMEAHGRRTPCANSATKSAEPVAAPCSARLTLPRGSIRWAELFAAPFSALAEYATDDVAVKLRADDGPRRTSRPARAPAAAVLHRAARTRRGRGGEGRRAARQLRAWQPRGRPAGARDRGGAARGR